MDIYFWFSQSVAQKYTKIIIEIEIKWAWELSQFGSSRHLDLDQKETAKRPNHINFKYNRMIKTNIYKITPCGFDNYGIHKSTFEH